MADKVQRKYHRLSRGPLRGEFMEAARDLGYPEEVLKLIPSEALLGLSCGVPALSAAISPGETVLDLGCGAGVDVFLAARRVGPRGRAIGIDMTTGMLDRARQAGERFCAESGLSNFQFLRGKMERLPVGKSRVDVVLSNCVFCLSEDKERVWHEISRVLKPGGRVAVSDLILQRNLPGLLRSLAESVTGLTIRATSESKLRRIIHATGFQGVKLEKKAEDLQQITACSRSWVAGLSRIIPPERFIARVDVSAIKPGA